MVDIQSARHSAHHSAHRGLAQGDARPLLERATDALRGALYGSTLYRLSLAGRAPDEMLYAPADPWPGDAARGAAILGGRHRFAGQVITDTRSMPWRAEGASPGWLAEAHGFGWLRDLDAAGSPGARDTAQRALAGWLRRCGDWSAIAWRADVLSRRIVAWLSHADLLFHGADELREGALASLAAQSRHLARIAQAAPLGEDRIAALKGVLFAAICLPRGDRRMAWALAMLDAEIARQVLADGCHIERSPSAHLRVFRDLAELRALLVATHRPVPGELQGAVDRMAPIVRFFRHGDGRLALFNDSSEDDAAAIDAALTLGEASGKAPGRASRAGFERLAAGRTVVLVDTGAPLTGQSRHAYAGPLSLEMSVGAHRLIVNCGAHPQGRAEWRAAQRTTAAHSTVTVGDTNAIEICGDGRIGRTPGSVGCTRTEDAGNIWIDASHDGYRANFGVTHRRRIWLGADGDDLRGEDVLSGSSGHDFTVRFHLHPAVDASLVAGGSGALLRVAGEGWRLRASGAALEIAQSIYLGLNGEARRAEQIVLTGRLEHGRAAVKWRLSRVA
jgi:uncharacterized heparinase superfamily protein